MKDIVTKNWGNDVINLSHVPNAQHMIELRPTEIHLIENGSLDNKPSFTFVLTHPLINAFPVIGQISLEMLNEAFNELGYEIKSK